MKQESVFTSSERTVRNIQEVSNTVPKRKSITSKQKPLAQVCFITRTATATQQSTAEPMRSKLRLSWRLTARTLRNRRRHKTATILTRNHHHFPHNHFPRRLNPSLLQRLVHLQEIDNHKNHGKTKNKEQRHKNNQRSISHGIFSSNIHALAKAELLVYEFLVHTPRFHISIHNFPTVTISPPFTFSPNFQAKPYQKNGEEQL